MRRCGVGLRVCASTIIDSSVPCRTGADKYSATQATPSGRQRAGGLGRAVAAMVRLVASPHRRVPNHTRTPATYTSTLYCWKNYLVSNRYSKFLSILTGILSLCPGLFIHVSYVSLYSLPLIELDWNFRN